MSPNLLMPQIRNHFIIVLIADNKFTIAASFNMVSAVSVFITMPHSSVLLQTQYNEPLSFNPWYLLQ